MRVLLQFPEGLKKEAREYAKKLEKEGKEVFLFAGATYGACDIPFWLAKIIRADKIIHFGHTPFLSVKEDIPVEYIVIPQDVKIDENELRKIGEKEIYLTSVAQYMHSLKKIKAILESMGKTVILKRGVFSSNPGQVLGCDASPSGRITLFIGDGLFHPTSVTAEKIYRLHPKTGKITDITDEINRIRKRRKASLISALEGKTFGILVSIKPGQFRLEIAKRIKKELEERNREAYIIVGDELSPHSIKNYSFIDVFITTACPKMADDREMWEKPILDLALYSEFKGLLKGPEGQNE